MNVEVRWLNRDKTVIHYRFSGQWDWEDFYAAFDSDAPCDVMRNICALIDLRGVKRVPTDAILHLKRAAQIAEQASGMIIVIATSGHTIMLYQLFLTIYKPLQAKFRLASDEREALDILQMPG